MRGESQHTVERIAMLRRKVEVLPQALDRAPEEALREARETAKWILQDFHREYLGEDCSESLRFPQIFEALRDRLPARVRIQLQTIQQYGTPEEREQDGTSDISREDVLPCVHALENVIRWYLGEVLESSEEVSIWGTVPPSSGVPTRGRKSSTEGPSSKRPSAPILTGSESRSPWILLLLAVICLGTLGLYVEQIQLMKHYSDRRIGFVIVEAEAGGLYITDVETMGPADRGGLAAEDQLLEIDGYPVDSLDDFSRAAEHLQRGKPAKVTLLRGGRELVKEVRPGLAADWTQPSLIGFSMLVCLVFGSLGLYHRPRDLRTRLLSAFLLMVALELSMSVQPLASPALDFLWGVLFFALTCGEMAVTLHLAALIPERRQLLRQVPGLPQAGYGIALFLALAGIVPYVFEELGGDFPLPWDSSGVSLVLSNWGLPLWAMALLLILGRPALVYPESQGRLQARLACLGLLPWVLGYVLPSLIFNLGGGEPPSWLEKLLPLMVLSFPGTIAAVILFEVRNHRRILLSLAQEIRGLQSVEDIAALVARDLDQAFHPRGLFVFLRHEASEELTLGHSTGMPSAVQKLPRHFEMTRRAEESGRILSNPTDFEGLPAVEAGWLERLGTRLVVPVNDSRRDLVGLILLGEKRSEEGYTKRDLRLLHSLAGQIALSFENLGLQSQLGEKTRIQREVLARLQEREINLIHECPVCSRCYDSDVEECPNDGSEVVLAVPVERVVAGRYRLEKVLGKGGVGSVYQARDLRLDRPVAVKVLLGAALDNPLAQRRFEREARVVAQLDHPNIVTVHDFGRTEVGNFFIVLELLEGVTLRNALRHRGAIPPAALAGWVGQILEGLKAAHRNGVVHRDLKPGNVFITRKVGRDEVVKLLDFGIAKTKATPEYKPGHLTLPGVVLGTVGYMAPEQVLGEEVDERADLYSVGVLVLEALLGKRPFQGSSPMEVMDSVSETSREVVGLFGGDLAGILDSCLARDPEQRYESAAHLQVDLVSALRQTLSKGDPEGSSEGLELASEEKTLAEDGFGVPRGPTEKIDLTGPVEAYLQGLRTELKGRGGKDS